MKSRDIRRLIPRRSKTSHKGANGHLLIIAGSRGMTGAAYLCALGALKTGAGLVTVASVDAVRKLIAQRLPEAMTVALEDVERYVRRRTITTLSIGPGLTVKAAIRRSILRLLKLRLPTVLDADGLNNVRTRDLKGLPIVITPHPGELARLLGTTTAKIQADRSGVAKKVAKSLGVICLLKGHKTIVTDGKSISINPTGNPAMATGGMGDVLTGVIGALLAQGLSLYNAALAGAYIHGLAGDIAATGDRGLLASELALSIPKAIRRVLSPRRKPGSIDGFRRSPE